MPVVAISRGPSVAAGGWLNRCPSVYSGFQIGVSQSVKPNRTLWLYLALTRTFSLRERGRKTQPRERGEREKSAAARLPRALSCLPPA